MGADLGRGYPPGGRGPGVAIPKYQQTSEASGPEEGKGSGGRGSGFEGVRIPGGAGPRRASQGQGPKIRVFPGAEAGRASALSADGVSAGHGRAPGARRGAARRESRPSGGVTPLDGREDRPPPCLPCNRLPP